MTTTPTTTSTDTTVPASRPRPPDGRPVLALARLEALRMLRHPAPWLGLALSLWWGFDSLSDPPTWASEHYEALQTAVTPLLLGISLAGVSVFGREHQPLAEEAATTPTQRSVARLLAGLVLVALTAVLVAAVAVGLRVQGGLPLGDVPGRTEHAYLSLPELVQPVLLAGFAVALGAAVVHLVRQRLAAGLVLFVTWFLVGATYWAINGPVARWFAPLQVQPVDLSVSPPQTDPSSFPASWLLSAPGEYQSTWDRLVVSPAMGAWHDVYLLGLTALLVAVAVPGRRRVVVGVGGLLVAAAAVALQAVVAP